MTEWTGAVKFPGSCSFCGHVRNGEGICQCPADCPSCGQGCCGQIPVAFLRPVSAFDPYAITVEAITIDP